MTKKSMDKYSRAGALRSQTEQGLRELALNFGVQFTYNRCQGIKTLSQP